MDISLAVLVQAIVAVAGLAKALHFLYEMFFSKPRKAIEDKVEKTKKEFQDEISALNKRVKEVEDYKIMSNVRHEQTQKSMEKMEEKMDLHSRELKDLRREITDKIDNVMDVLLDISRGQKK